MAASRSRPTGDPLVRALGLHRSSSSTSRRCSRATTSEDLRSLLLPRLLRRYAQDAREPVAAPAEQRLGPRRPGAARARCSPQRSVLLVPRTTLDVPERRPRTLARAAANAPGGSTRRSWRSTAAAARTDFLAWWGAHVEQTLGSLDARRGGAPPGGSSLAGALPRARPRALLDGRARRSRLQPEHVEPASPHARAATREGSLVDGRWPLRFLNLPGFDPDRPYRLNAMASRARVSRSPVLRELCERYAEELRAAGWQRRRASPRRSAGASPTGSSTTTRCARCTRRRSRSGELRRRLQRGGHACVPRLAAGTRAAGRRARHQPLRLLPRRARATRRAARLPRPRRRGRPRRTSPGAGRSAAAELGDPRALHAAASRRTRPRRAGAAPRTRPPAPRPAAGRARTRPAASRARVRRRDGPGPAVRLTGYLGHTLGLGAAARGYVQALDAAGVPVSTVSVPLHHLALPVELEDGVRPARLRGSRPRRPPRLRDRRRQRRRASRTSSSGSARTTSRGRASASGAGRRTAIPARWQRAFALVRGDLGVLALHGREHRRGRRPCR